MVTRGEYFNSRLTHYYTVQNLHPIIIYVYVSFNCHMVEIPSLLTYRESRQIFLPGAYKQIKMTNSSQAFQCQTATEGN